MKEVMYAVKAYEDAINQNRIVGSVCSDCGTVAVPPRPICRKCDSDKVDITTIDNTKGKLITWTVIHIAPPSHLDHVPYILGIVEMDNGEKLTGIVDLPENVEPQFDMELVADFEEGQEGARRLRWKIQDTKKNYFG
ncbi:MAG: Zn-ribbon domain-containing OB-fold protein [Candidatus Kariarchaeaceae archaeon]|jgi:uncharacterized OB-fold protein